MHFTQFLVVCISTVFVVVVVVIAIAIAIVVDIVVVGNAISRAIGHVGKFAEPIAVSFGVVIIAGGVAWYSYDRVKERMEGEYKSKIDAMMAGGEAPAAAPSAPIWCSACRRRCRTRWWSRPSRARPVR